MIREYTWGSHFGGGIGGLLALKQNGNTYSYLYDGKGNVVSVIDSLQAEAVRYRYNSFGKLVNSAGTLQQSFGFSTKRYSDTLGVNYYGYRFYNPQIERWMNRDPIGEAGGINLYEFVGGNPVSWVDSWGQSKTKGIIKGDDEYLRKLRDARGDRDKINKIAKEIEEARKNGKITPQRMKKIKAWLKLVSCQISTDG